MVYFDVRSTARPGEAEIRQTAQGERIIYLRRNVVETQDDDGKGYSYDEAVFTMPPDRTDTLEQIRMAEDDWWLYAGSESNRAPDIRERVDSLEEAVLVLSEIIMGGE